MLEEERKAFERGEITSSSSAELYSEVFKAHGLRDAEIDQEYKRFVHGMELAGPKK